MPLLFVFSNNVIAAPPVCFACVESSPRQSKGKLWTTDALFIVGTTANRAPTTSHRATKPFFSVKDVTTSTSIYHVPILVRWLLLQRAVRPPPDTPQPYPQLSEPLRRAYVTLQSCRTPESILLISLWHVSAGSARSDHHGPPSKDLTNSYHSHTPKLATMATPRCASTFIPI